MVYLTAAEAKSRHIEKMGEALGLQFNALWHEVVWLHIKWGEFVQLFGSKPMRIELLNQAAPAFFHMIQDILWDDTLLHIARLTDRSKSSPRHNRVNLTIQNLPQLVEGSTARKS